MRAGTGKRHGGMAYGQALIRGPSQGAQVSRVERSDGRGGAHGGYLLVTGLIAVIVYERVRLRFLRTAWVNLDLVWAVALVIAGAVTVFMQRSPARASHGATTAEG